METRYNANVTMLQSAVWYSQQKQEHWAELYDALYWPLYGMQLLGTCIIYGIFICSN